MTLRVINILLKYLNQLSVEVDVLLSSSVNCEPKKLDYIISAGFASGPGFLFNSTHCFDIC